MSKSCIAIITFNVSNLIAHQIGLLRRFCKDSDLDIVIIDNSNNKVIANEIRDIVSNLGCKYVKTSFHDTDFSYSHATACNFAYTTYRDSYNFIFLLDHDNFPITDFSIEEVLRDKMLAGVGQVRNNKYYFWPGCLLINNYTVDKALVDFSPSSKFGLDTGGSLYPLIEKYGMDRFVHFDQFSIPNEQFEHWNYVLIKSLKDAPFSLAFMHFINASNWNKVNNSNNNGRINSLLTILESYVGALER